MTGIGLQSGLRALLSSKTVIDTIGHNLANANTDGYSRQNVHLAAGRPGLSRGLLVGSGVDAISVQRSIDSLLQRRILSQTSISGRLESQFTGLSEIEALLGEPDGFSLGSQMDGFFSSLSSLSVNAGDSILRTGVVNSGVQVASQFNQLAGGLHSVRADTGREVAIRVNEVNRLGQQVSALNREISAANAAGLNPNDLLDQRDLAIKSLTKLVDTTTQEDPSGAVRVLVGGNTLVSTTQVHKMTSSVGTDGVVSLSIDSGSTNLQINGGTLGGLLKLNNSTVPGMKERLDLLARNLILEFNRVHSTGIPSSGAFSGLTASNKLVDVDKDGSFRDELLSNSGLPVEILSGQVSVNVTDSATGEIRKYSIEVDRTHTTVGQFVDAITDIPNLVADIDALGRMQIVADAGHGFDFSGRLDVNPDHNGTFGGGKATLGSAVSEPFAFVDGDSLDFSVGGTPVSIAFSAADFEQINSATAEEIAAVINADAGAQANGLTAVVDHGKVFVQSAGSGSGTSFDVVGGSALAALGLASSAGTTVSGQDSNVEVIVSGSYSGESNGTYTFLPSSDGTIGTTPGLTVDVLDATGARVATLDVGPEYVPGTELEVANGVKVSFGLGDLSATTNDSVTIDLVADSDTTDALVALGFNSLFTGKGADDIALVREIELDPSRIASSSSGSDGDNRVLLDMLDIEGLAVGELSGTTLGEYYGDVVGELGFEVNSISSALDSNNTLMESLQLRQDQISGVNVDEELVDLLQFEQSYQAASRYISLLSDLNDELLALL